MIKENRWDLKQIKDQHCNYIFEIYGFHSMVEILHGLIPWTKYLRLILCLSFLASFFS